MRKLGSPPARFATTRWSLVRAAGRAREPSARPALAELCAAYWYPLYAWARRSGHRAEEAADLVQGFFAQMLERDDLARLDEQGGRFRAWILAALRHHASDERERARAQKRGGGRPALPLDEAEALYAREPASVASPERLFERKWALAVLERALVRLEALEVERGRASAFQHLRIFLVADADAAPLVDVADALGLTPNAARVAVHRLRRRYRDLVVAEVAATVRSPLDLSDELQRLFAALAP